MAYIAVRQCLCCGAHHAFLTSSQSLWPFDGTHRRHRTSFGLRLESDHRRYFFFYLVRNSHTHSVCLDIQCAGLAAGVRSQPLTRYYLVFSILGTPQIRKKTKLSSGDLKTEDRVDLCVPKLVRIMMRRHTDCTTIVKSLCPSLSYISRYTRSVMSSRAN